MLFTPDLSIYYLTGSNTRILLSKFSNASSTWSTLSTQSFSISGENYYFVGKDLAVDPTNSSVLLGAGKIAKAPASTINYYGPNVIKSTNNGSTWTNIFLAQWDNESQTANAIALDPSMTSKLFVGASARPPSASLITSTDAGAHWYDGFADRADYRAVLVDRNSPKVADGSSSIAYAAGLIPVIPPGTVPVRVIQKTTDAGTTWQPLNGLPSSLFLLNGMAIDPNNSSVLYSCSESGDLIKSTDSGTDWISVRPISPPYSYFCIMHHPALSNYVYVGAEYHGQWSVLATTNGGVNWMTLSATSPLPTNAAINHLAFDVSPTAIANSTLHCPFYLYAATAIGLFRIDVSSPNIPQASVPSTIGWNMVSVPLYLCNFAKTAVYPAANSGAYSYSPSSGYTVQSTLSNGVGYWVKFNSGVTNSYNGLAVTAFTIAIKNGWNMIGSLSPSSSAFSTSSITTVPPGIITSKFYGYNGAYVASTTVEPGKAYWVKCNAVGTITLDQNSTANNPPSTLPYLPPDPPAAPAAPASLSPADGTTNVPMSATLSWATVPGATSYSGYLDTDPNFSSEIQIHFVSTTAQAVVVLNCATPYYWHVMSINDFGSSDWSATNMLTTVDCPPAPYLTWVGVVVNGVKHPKLSWTVPSGLTSPYYVYRYFCPVQPEDCMGSESLIATTSALNYTDLLVNVADKYHPAVSTAYYYVKATVSGGGLSASSNKAIVNTSNISWQAGMRENPEEQVQNPDAYCLSPNYPNPFNPTTTIAYTLPEDQYVQLVIVNVLGQEVARLVDGFESAGYKKVEFQSGSLPSGVYYYHLKAGTFDDVKKMLIAK